MTDLPHSTPPSTPPVALLQPEYASPPVVISGPKKPTSVIVLCIIGMLLGGLGAVCTPIGLIFMTINMGVPNPVVDAMKSDPMLMAWTWFAGLMSIVMGALLLASSI